MSASEPEARERLRFPGVRAPKPLLPPETERRLTVRQRQVPYDRFIHARHQQCLAHVQRRCRELLEVATRGAVRFPQMVQRLLREIFRLRRRYAAEELDADQLAESGLWLADALDRLTAGRFTHEGVIITHLLYTVIYCENSTCTVCMHTFKILHN